MTQSDKPTIGHLRHRSSSLDWSRNFNTILNAKDASAKVSDGWFCQIGSQISSECSSCARTLCSVLTVSCQIHIQTSVTCFIPNRIHSNHVLLACTTFLFHLASRSMHQCYHKPRRKTHELTSESRIGLLHSGYAPGIQLCGAGYTLSTWKSTLHCSYVELSFHH